MSPPNLHRAVRQLLDDWRSAGLTHLPKPAPVEVVHAAESTAAPAVPVAPPVLQEKSPAPMPKVVKPVEPVKPPKTLAESVTREDRELALGQLAKTVAACVRCQELASTRTQTVFGVGNPEARVMFVGEAPGADEDAQGEPFVGRAGQLLNKIITACGWTREELYICNILRCRPPGNRTPSPVEASNCREYLDGQIGIVDPDYIVCWGSCAAQNLLGMPDAIGKLRGRFFEYGRAKVLCTYHPSYLLRNPEAKKPVWDDMQLLLKAMGLTPPPTAGSAKAP